MEGSDNFLGNSITPSARSHGCSWLDTRRSVIYLYGGHSLVEDDPFGDMWSLQVAPANSSAAQSFGWRLIGQNTSRSAYESLIFSYSSSLVWPGSRHHALCWQGKNSQTTEDLFFLYGGISGAPSDPILANDLYVFDPSTLQWAYILGNYGKIRGDGPTAFPPYNVTDLTALQWQRSDTIMEFYFSANPIVDRSKIGTGAPLSLRGISEDNWWKFDFTWMKFAAVLNPPLSDGMNAKTAWIAPDGSNFMLVPPSVENALTSDRVPISGFPSTSILEARVVANYSLACVNRIWLLLATDNRTVAGVIEQKFGNSSRLFVLAESVASSPRATVGYFSWRLSDAVLLTYGGRLAASPSPIFSGELWRHEILYLTNGCTPAAEAVGPVPPSRAAYVFPISWLLIIIFAIILFLLILSGALCCLLVRRRRGRTLSLRSKPTVKHDGGNESSSDTQLSTFSGRDGPLMTSGDHGQRHDADCTCTICQSGRGR